MNRASRIFLHLTSCQIMRPTRDGKDKHLPRRIDGQLDVYINTKNWAYSCWLARCKPTQPRLTQNSSPGLM